MHGGTAGTTELSRQGKGVLPRSPRTSLQVHRNDRRRPRTDTGLGCPYIKCCLDFLAGLRALGKALCRARRSSSLGDLCCCSSRPERHTFASAGIRTATSRPRSRWRLRKLPCMRECVCTCVPRARPASSQLSSPRTKLLNNTQISFAGRRRYNRLSSQFFPVMEGCCRHDMQPSFPKYN